MDFEKLDLTELDKDLSEEQRKEWNAIYASYRSGSYPDRPDCRHGHYGRYVA